MIKRLLRILFLYVPLGLVAASLLMVLFMKWVPVKWTPLMLKRGIEQREWVRLENVSPNMVRAVIAAEDQKFLTHNGFDREEIAKVRDRHRRYGGRLRGCSTISQQTAKNCFTSGSRTWLRKGVEAYYTVLIEWIWGKRRIMEVYLNVVELGPGIYGVEAAAQKYYRTHAAKLTASQAASIACCLPNPLRRTPGWAERHMGSRRAQIIRESKYIDIKELR